MGVLTWLVALASVADVRVTLAPADAGAVCVLRDAAGAVSAARPVRAEGGGRFVFGRAPRHTLSCEAPGFEPLDLDASGTAELPPRIELQRARTVTLLRTDDRPAVVVEWRLPGPTTLIARRPGPGEGAVAVPVATSGRVLRLRRGDRSPVSLIVPPGTADLAFELPAAAAGGEVFGALAPVRYRPDALVLESAAFQRTLKPDAAGFFQATGVPAGTYSLAPLYRGGVPGRPATVVVRSGETADVMPLGLPPTGAARFTLEPAHCGESGLTLGLHRRADQAAGPAELTRRFPSASCELELQGLDEGIWTAALARADAGFEVEASASFTVARGERVDVPLLPSARVTGFVTLGGLPGAALRLLFRLGPDEWNAETAEDGSYSVLLGPTGSYAVSIRTAQGLPSQSFVRPYVAGRQEDSFELGDGGLVVRVARDDGTQVAETVTLSLSARDGPRTSGAFDPRLGEPARFVGLPLGEYTIAASTESGLVSTTPGRVELSAEVPSAEADVLLGRHAGVLRLVDPSGLVVAGARASVGDAPLAEASPGVFRLDTVAAGERIQVLAPGFTPMCRVLVSGDLPELVLPLQAAPEQMTLRLAPELPWQTGSLVGLPGSDCPVAVDQVDSEIQWEPHAVTVRLKLPRGVYLFYLGSQANQADVPGELVLSAN
jgi:hypothetical protein